MSVGWLRPIIGLWFLAGAAAELFNAWTRRLLVERLDPERRARSVGWFVGGFVVRVVLTAGVLALAFRYGLASGLTALMGYYVCRSIVTWRLAGRLARLPGEGRSRNRLGSKDG